MNLREKIKNEVVGLLGHWISGSVDEIERLVEVTRVTDQRFGDYTSNLALRLAKSEKRKAKGDFQSPMETAKKISQSLQKLPYLKKLEVKEPGFINFWIDDKVWQDQVKEVLDLRSGYGSNDLGKGKRARVEFVSANPTGPLHFGNARGGPIGDCLASVLEFSGYKVLREYLNNDRGNQVMELGRSLAAKLRLVEVNEENLSYKGEYTSELAAIVEEQIGETSNLSETNVIAKAGELGVKAMFDEIIRDCEEIGVKFDSIVNESDFQKEAPSILNEFDDKKLLKNAEGATWFAPRNEFLKDKDAVVIKSDGAYTYFTADLIYHKQKFESGYDLVIDVFGSNTSGHVPKLRALADVLGYDQAKFKVILYQYVRVKRGQEVVRMSKRAGDFVTLREVLNEVGRDALRFFILMHDANTHMDFDLALAKKKSSENPVYYVQYAHARIASILAKTKDEGLKTNANYQLLTTNYELGLIRQITRFPEFVEDISQNFTVHHLTRYAIELAETFHKFYENCRVLAEKEDLKLARLALVKATQITLANTFRLLGVSAPEKM